MAHCRRVFLAVLMLTLVPRAAAAADTWVEVKSQNFTVISNASERKARNVAWQFEQVRAAIQKGWPWVQVTVDRPVLVFAAKDENTLKALAPSFWERRGESRPGSIFWSTGDALYVALRADLEVDAQGLNPYHQAFWAYSTLVIGQSFKRGVPLWLANGLATVLSNTTVSEKEIAFGKPLPWLTDRLQALGRLPLPNLLGVTRESSYYRRDDTRDQFDAQSWALVQYMIFGQRGDMGGRFTQLCRLILQGVPSLEAAAQVFGSLETLESDYWLYASRGIFTFGRLQVESDTSALKVPSRVLSDAEHAATRAGFHVALGRPSEARALLAEARKGPASLAIIDDVEGRLRDREEQDDPAKQAFAKAAAAGSTHFWTYYRLASLQFVAGLSPEALTEIHGHLARAATLNPNHAPTFALLASVQLQRRQNEAAVEAAYKAATLDPASVFSRLMLARALMATSRLQEAETVARDAVSIALTDQDRRSVQDLLNALAAVPRAAPR